MYWDDAAYVAERVLTVKELKRYVDREWPTGAASPPNADANGHDWFIHRGVFEQAPLSEARDGTHDWSLARASRRETRRVREHAPWPDKRFHYRYVAMGLAWKAALLMPDQSEETARVLWSAGSWVKDRDPQAADPFYKMLVRRCGKTPLGAMADQRRWFPPAEAVAGPSAPRPP